MPLTTRQNGNSAGNIIQASWFNDYYNLLTGAMTDQPVTLVTDVVLKAIGAAPGSGVAIPQTGSGLGVGTYTYAVTFKSVQGETLPGTTFTATTSPGTQQVALSSIPTGPTGTVARNIYRSTVGATAPLYLLVELNDNTTTTYTDTSPDSSITSNAHAPLHPSFGGTLLIQDSSGNNKGIIYNDGAIWFDDGNIHSDGNGNFYANQGNFSSFVSEHELNSDGGKFTSDGYGNVVVNSLSLGGVTNNNAGIYSDASASVSIDLGDSGTSNFFVQKKPAVGQSATLLEVQNSGNVIAGGAYKTTGSTSSIGTGASFDSFDFAECYETDRYYEHGAVVCPGKGGVLSQCTHDACKGAAIISHTPGFCAGTEDTEKNWLSVALVGRIRAITQTSIQAGDMVCSDGKGGVRTLLPDDIGFVLGIALEDSQTGKVGILIRPFYYTPANVVMK